MIRSLLLPAAAKCHALALLGLATGFLTTPTPAQAAWHLRSPTTHPPVRAHSGMAFDSGRNLTVMFGGDTNSGNTKRNDTWEWNGVDWTQRFPTTIPSGRNVLSLAYDSARGRTVMFGGVAFDGSGPGLTLADTWEWNGTDWLLQSPAHAPAPRCGYAMTYDAARGTVLMFGGTVSAGGCNDETWEWDGTDWTQRFPATLPVARFACAMAFDSLLGRAVLFGGLTQSQANLADTWEWDGANWTQRFPANSPSGRSEHAMTYDVARQRVVLFGGYFLADTWEWDGSDWTAAATSPGVRRAPSIAHDSTRGRTVLFGGQSWSGYLDDTWEYLVGGVPGTHVAFGQGCPGTAGVPLLGVANGGPVLGTTFTLAATNLPPDHFTTLLFGFSRTNWNSINLPFDLTAWGMPGCMLLVSADYVATLLNWNGTAQWALAIPNDARLLGVTFYTQVGVIDRVNTLGMIATNAREARIGNL